MIDTTNISFSGRAIRAVRSQITQRLHALDTKTREKRMTGP